MLSFRNAIIRKDSFNPRELARLDALDGPVGVHAVHDIVVEQAERKLLFRNRKHRVLDGRVQPGRVARFEARRAKSEQLGLFKARHAPAPIEAVDVRLVGLEL